MQPIIVGPQDGKSVTAFGDTIVFKLVGSQTGNGVTIGVATAPPGGGPPLHVHHREDEIFIVESGDMEVNVGGEWLTAAPGSLIYLPKDVPHQFRNAGQTTLRFWMIAMPSGFEGFYERCEEIFAAGGPPNMEKIFEACSDFGLEILGPPPGAH
jgi:mannose-6-phosphate isomerase-like protein (cupin superfamily)